MWWCRVTGAALLLLMLAGCGFRPLYGTHASDPYVGPELGSIYIAPLPDRDGQLVRNALLDAIDTKGEPSHPRYRLEITLTINEAQVALSKDETATRAQVSYAVAFTLFEGAVRLTKGSFSRVFAYDYLNQQYSNISAREDIRRRAAQEIATEIRNRMATYFIRAKKARDAAGVQQPADSAQ
jgi:LPS-assembly lipoprotein